MSACPLDQPCRSLSGALFFSAVVSTSFYGVTCMQTFFYYVHYRNRDPLRMKSFVAVLWALDTVHEALTAAGVYKFIMADLTGQRSTLGGVSELTMLFTALVALPTQGFFIYRTYVFSGKNIVVPLIWVPLAMYQLASAAIYVGSVLYNMDHIDLTGLHVFHEKIFMVLLTSTLYVAAAVDVLVAVFSTFLLFRKRTATGLSGEAHVLQRLAVFAVNTGIWTAVFALLAAILLHLSPLTFLSLVFGVPLCSVYCNTLLANLNVRAYIRDAIHNNGESEGYDGSKIDQGDEHLEHHRDVMEASQWRNQRPCELDEF